MFCERLQLCTFCSVRLEPFNSGADQINIAVHQVNELCGKNRESIDMLVREVSRFKVE